MHLYVADPQWGWWIILYFYLGGIAAGAYFTATMIDLFGRNENHRLAVLGYRIAFPLVALCGIFLTVDLERPERFWHMLFKSEIVHEAIRQGWPLSGTGWRTITGAPLLKYWSPMSIGAWALLIFGLCSLISFLGSLWSGSRLEAWFRHSLIGRLFQLIGCLVGFFIAAYTGALLSATNQPLWSDSVWIAPLFMASAGSTGMAALMLLYRRNDATDEGTILRLRRADTFSMIIELVVFIVFLVSLGGLLVPVLRTIHGSFFIVGTLILGLLFPLGLHLLHGRRVQQSEIVPAALTLLGGLILRYGILTTPPELLAHAPNLSFPSAGRPTAPIGTEPAALVKGFSPEDGRPRGGGPGADAGNKVDNQVEPRSKVFDGQ
jgi:formate-dependent nitrite reductase membrane component NrfD